jgi:cytochrome c peroxidase
MHNGVFRTLEDVVRFYDGGGGHGLGIRAPQTLPTDSLHLTAVERAAIVAFMKSLTDTAGTTRVAERFER